MKRFPYVNSDNYRLFIHAVTNLIHDSWLSGMDSAFIVGVSYRKRRLRDFLRSIFSGILRMNFAQEQRDPRRHLMGISTVILLHALAIYALANGLAHKVVEVLKKPLDVSIIEELKKTPPPPPPKVVPKVVVPPPAFVPPPEVQVQAQTEPVISVTAPTPPPPVAVVAPPPPAPIPAPPRVASVGVVCPDHVAVLGRIQVPPQAQGQAGRVLVEFLVGANGAVTDVSIVKSTNRLFNAVATAAVGQLHCVGQGQNVRVQVPFVFEQDR